MQQLIDDLLKYSRVGTRAKTFVTVDCSQVIAQVLHNLQVTVRETGANVVVEALPTIQADETQNSPALPEPGGERDINSTARPRPKCASGRSATAPPGALGWRITGLALSHSTRNAYCYFPAIAQPRGIPGHGHRAGGL